MTKIVIRGIKEEINFNNEQLNHLIVENPNYYYTIASSLINQVNDIPKEEYFYYTRNDKFMDFKRSVEIILSPLNFDYNYKKINLAINKYILSEIKQGNTIIKFNELNSKISSFLQEVKEEVALPIDFKDDFQINDLLKLSDFHYDYNQEKILNKTIDYINILIDVTNISLVILIGFNSVFSLSDFSVIDYEFKSKQVNLLFIDSYDKTEHTDNEKTIIIDKDLCEI